MDNHIDNKSYLEAVEKVKRMMEVRDCLVNQREVLPCGDEQLDNAIKMLDSINLVASEMMQRALEASRQVKSLARSAARVEQQVARANESASGTGIGSMVASLGKDLVKGAGMIVKTGTETVVPMATTVLKAAEPITTQALKTTKSVVDTISNSAKQVSSTIGKTVADVSANVQMATQTAAKSFITNSTNLATSLTNTATNTINTILGSNPSSDAQRIVKSALSLDTTNVATSAVQKILNP